MLTSRIKCHLDYSIKLRYNFFVISRRSLRRLQPECAGSLFLIPIGTRQVRANRLFIHAVDLDIESIFSFAQKREESGVKISSMRITSPSIRPNSNLVSAKNNASLLTVIRERIVQHDAVLAQLFGKLCADQFCHLLEWRYPHRDRHHFSLQA